MAACERQGVRGTGELERGLNIAREAAMLAENTDAINLHGDTLMDLAEVASMAGERDDANSAIEADGTRGAGV